MTKELNEIETCCNSGCNNCILDTYQRQHDAKLIRTNDSKINLFDGSYRQFKLTSIESYTETVQRLRFQIVTENVNKDEYMIEVPPTFHLFIRAPTATANLSKNDENTKENYISRPYTPIAYNASQFSFDVLVKFEQNGRMSTYLKNLKIGDITEWKGCYGDFVWVPNPLRYKYLVCICQGVAIAPMFSLISSILSNEDDETVIYLLVCFKDLENYLLRSELVQFNKFWNFHCTVYLSLFIHDKKCTDNRRKNCSCLRLFSNETICPYRLNNNELNQFYNELGCNLIFTLFCGTNTLENLVKTCNNINMDNYYCFQ